MATQKAISQIVIAHSGLDRKITQDECLKSLSSVTSDEIIFIDFEIVSAKLSELYQLPYEQLALEQQRKFKREIKPVLDANPDATVVYFGFAPIPLAFQLGVLIGNTHKIEIFQLHHEEKAWYKETEPIEGNSFEITPIELPNQTQKGKGDIFIRVSTSYRIEPQHSYEVLPNPTNEFDIVLKQPHVDSISNQEQVNAVGSAFQKVISAYNNFLPDRDKIHLFISSTPGVAFILGTKINPNVCPFVQTYQFSKDEAPKYKEAILITKKSDAALAFSDEEKKLAAEIREGWSKELHEKIKPFIKNSVNTFPNWFAHITQNDVGLSECLKGSWGNLPDLSKTSLLNDIIDLETANINNGFTYKSSESKWQIDDGMFVSLNKRLSKIENTDIRKAGRLFLFHEGLHYSPDGHNLIQEIATGIGRFPKVIEEADYQADVWGLLYEYKYSNLFNVSSVDANLKKFFLDSIDTAVETMWSFVDLGAELTEIQIRSMNRFLNWYWQWIRIERLSGNGTLKEIVQILFDKPVIEFAGPEVLTLDGQRVFYKLNTKRIANFELAVFYNNRVYRFASTGIVNVVEGFRELNGNKVKESLRSFYSNLG
jgi:SMODS-associated and fused to various effectors sensor domain